MASDPKLYKWGPKGMLVAKATDPEQFIEKADLGLLGGPNSPIVKKLMGFKWGAKGMVAGTKYARNSDVIALFKPAVPATTPSVPAPPTPPVATKAITRVRLVSTSAQDQTNVPVTFGQVFAPGDVPAGASVNSTTPIQVDAKATHPDGSLRHAVISTVLPVLRAGETVDLPLGLGAPLPGGTTIGPYSHTGIIQGISLILDGKVYAVEKGWGMQSPKRVEWLGGRLARELRTAVPLLDPDGVAHPHLSAIIAVRCYHGTGRTRIEVVVENDWAYEPNPQNFTYDVLVTVAGKEVYAQKGLQHRHHSRWRKLFWLGEEPRVHVKHDAPYLLDTRALPNFDRNVVVAEKLLAKFVSDWTGPKTEPMGLGLATPGMPGPGAHRDIGLLPDWGAAHLLSMDPRAAMVDLGTADLAGSWSMHYRDKNTGLPVSVIDYPYMTIYGRSTDTKNPKTGKYEAFPALPKGSGGTAHDSAHQPSFAYLPYLLTGDHYYLEEVQFWAMWNVLQTNPGYRKNVQGLLLREQVRGQSWGMRTLGHAAYITPDSHPLKGHFRAILESNLAAYHAEYITNPSANKLGVVAHANAVVYDIDDPLTEQVEENNSIGVFQDEFFTSVMGYLTDMGFTAAKPLLEYKIQFSIGRLVGEGVNWQSATNYAYRVRPAPGEPFYETIGEAFRATVGPAAAAVWDDDAAFANARGMKLGDLGGYSNLTTGFPANMQPAVAYAADYGGERGKQAWAKFMLRTVKPDYGLGPQFAVVPRSVTP